MASSLRRQVDALRHASSGTSSGYIQRKKGKPSLLLTPDQAAEVDLSSVRETAVMGLQRLEAVDQDFSPFQDTLFSKEAEGTLRDLQTKESNDRIDKSISAFLALLSPHFACREAHFCLEYLIRHYKVYQYNVDAVVECCLPWHDTVAFARMVQLLSLKGSRWEFLTPVQKTGSPLPREAIARRCARDFGLLRFLCVSARRAAARAASCSVATAQSTSTSSVSAATAAGRAKLFSFYAATVVEALASLGTTSDPLLRALVPTVVHGLSATKSPEYQMASYMILSALSGKGPLSLDVTGQALTALVCKPCQGGLEPSLLCALAVAQTQVGFYSKKDPSNSSAAAPLLLPTAAFEKLSAMESLAGVLAGLAQKFDATAFLWLLLQSYVQHLPDQDSRHGESLTRLCTYPYWPSHSLPRLIRRLVDRLIRSYLALTLEGAEDEAAMEVDDAPEKSRRSTAMKTESQTVLRVLSQRYPEEVDAAVAKISRSVTKARTATAKAALQDDDKRNDAGVMTAKREAHLKKEALSSLLVSTFAGAQLAPHLPLQQQEEDAATVGQEGREDGAVHGSLMVALEHSSAVVRARAVEQLSRAILSAAENDGAAAGESASTSAGGVEELSPVLVRRLHDEDPDVVLAITESDTLVQRVLLRPRSFSPMADDSTGGDGVGGADDSDVVDRAAAVASAAMTAAGPWLSAISEVRPKHPVASAGRVLCGLVRLAAAASSACGEGGSAGVKQARDPALSLLLECLPGPHATARVRSAQRQAVGADGRGDSATDEGATDPAAAAAATGKACKKASRAVGRAAIEAVSRLGVGVEGDALAGLFAVVGKVLNKSDDEGSGKGSAAKSPGKNNSKKKKSGDADDLEAEGVKSKGLKVMGEEVCDALAAAIVGPGDLDSKNHQLQTLRDTCGAGGRWLVLECTYRALNLASASSSGGGNAKARAAATAAASSLSSLLASLATSELRLRPHLLSASPDGDDAKVVGAVGAADLLRYLRACAAHLPRLERSSSLFAEDHLAASAATPSVGGNCDTSVGGDGFAVTPAPLLGDVLVSVLTATAEGGSKGGATAVWEAVSAVVLHGYERRPLPALAAVAIEGVTVAGRRGRGVAARQQPRRGGGVDDAKLVAAARALCVAATFVRAGAEAVASGDTVEDGESSKAAERDIVAVFPAAVLAVASDDEGLRDSGLLFITTVSAHGDALSAELSGSSGGASTSGAKKSKPAPSPGPRVEDSEFLPLGQMGDGAAEPSSLNAPSLSSLVELAAALAGKNRESALDAGELTRHLATVLGEAAGGGWQEDVLRYLVAWAARLGWRDPTASALLLECLVWAKTPMRECCLPLLRCCLDSEQAQNNQNNERLLNILLGVTLNLAVGDATVAAVAVAVAEREESSRNTKSPKKTTRGSKDKASAAEDYPASASSTIFASVEAEQLMHRALRSPGPAQSHALHCLCATSLPSCGVGAQPRGEDESTRQRRDLVAVLVEAGLAGADGSLVAAAARALPCLPGDMAALLVGLPPLSGAGAGASTPSKGRKKKSSAAFKADTATTETGWVLTLGGLVELAQALCGPSSSSSSVPDQQQQSQSESHSTKGVRNGRGAVTAGATTSAEGWGWAGPLAIARPLFDVLPSLIAVVTKGAAEEEGSSSTAVGGGDVVDAAEYGLWLTMDVLGGVLRRWGKGGVGGGGGSAAAEKLYEGCRAGEDAETVLACVRENPSPQTRNSALALLSRMATLFPAQMASRLRSLLDAVCAAAAGGEGRSSGGGGGGGARAALRQTQKAVQSVVPALKAHGSEAGVGAHFVVQVFVEALDDAPAHARRALFSTLVDSLGEESLAIMSALLLRRAVSSGRPDVGGKSADEETTSALIEFVHQTIHRSRARGQVRTLVGLVQACHRLSVSAAERSGSLSGQALDEAVECFVEDSAASEKGEDQLKTDYLQLPLVQQEPARDKKASSPAFMTMDLRALSEEDSKYMAGNFLELVLSFVRDHLVSRPLVMAVAAAAERGADGKGLSEDEGIQEGFLLLCEELLLFLRTLSVCGRVSSSGSGDEPAWSSLQGLAYAVFETLQSLLSVPSFVAVTQELLLHQDPHLRRKALRMFTRRLDPAEGGGSGGAPRLSPGEESLFVEMVPSLRLVAMGKRSVGRAGEDDDDIGEGIEEVMGPSSPEGGEGGPDAMDQDRDEDGMKESAVNRQTALLSLDVLARVLGRRHQGAFEGVLGDVTEMVAGVGPGALPAVGQPGSDGILPLRASAFLLVATLCAVLGVRAFPRLPRFFPAMLEALEFQTPFTTAVTDGAAGAGGRGGGRSLLWTSALSAVATVAASLPSFLSPYLGRILAVALRPASAGAGSSGSPAAAGSKQAADRVLSLLSTGVEARLLVPAVCGAYSGCVESVKAGEEEGVGAAGRSIARLLAYVQEIVAGLEKAAASAALPQLTRLLTQALDFRRQHASGSTPQVRESAALVETEASSALVGLVMRLSEVELRPLFLHLCEWKAGVSSGEGDLKATLGALDRRLSFYRVLDGLAGALKSIFTPYFAHVLTDCCDDMEAASLLTSVAANGSPAAAKKKKRKRASEEASSKRKRRKTLSSGDASDSDEEIGEGNDGEGEDTPELRWRRSAASRLVLSALRRCFQSDRSGFVNKTRFELVLPAVVAQLECGSDFSAAAAGGGAEDDVSSCRLHAEELVGPCLAQLASASGKDALWKALANAVLMKTRSRRAGVRVAALVSLRQCFEVVGEEFLALLPECLPFLSELLEDGHPEVESECRALVKYIEGVLGESIESYLV
ncbi:conserved unknown protein [Ectocarpus siliculosus]|uniref:HEAT repeat-containing protein 1 n=1 Tax=Ectocarpus siliculosus TaxID=2880 RepID=D7FJ23_ECTSI|nr:conserved unknown protein [Ectocarpus siliculosus]|eukprot:CBJ49062.1 conserved unknown protein [Ectocarpus siliculosus]